MPYKNKDDQREYDRKWHHEHLDQSRARKLKTKLVLHRIKLELGCEHCGYEEDPIALQFHHIDASQKEISMHEVNYSLIKLLKESEKCMVLCANCHLIEEYRLNENSLY